MLFKKETQIKKTGGIPFFISLISVYILSSLNITNLPELFDSFALRRICYFGSGVVIGLWFAETFVKGKFSVFLHELKHAVVSGLVGNKSKGFEVQEKTGKFIYHYTNDTAQYNALIALAPYFLPLFLFFSSIFALIFFRDNQTAVLISIGAGYGFDFLLNVRDIGPHQTDIKHITFGYYVGIIYILGMNLFILSSISGYIFQNFYGLKYLAYETINTLTVYIYALHSLIFR